MISTIFYVALPTVVVLGIIRKCIEYQWGKFNENVSLAGKVAIVTGANSGIGKETVRGLVSRDATVIMACKDIMDARKAIHDIRKTTVNGYMIPLYLDLSSFKSIKMFANVVLQDYKQIHILINNAGVAVPYLERTKDNFEYNFGINYLGHFYLTQLLLPRLLSCRPSRVIVLSSKLMKKGYIDFDNLNSEIKFDDRNGKLQSYYNSKLQNAYFGYQLGQNMSNKGVTVYTVSPGLTKTRLFRYSTISWYQLLAFIPIAFFVMRTPKQACQTVLYCAMSDEVKDDTSLVYRNCEVYPFRFDRNIAKSLWDITDKIVRTTATSCGKISVKCCEHRCREDYAFAADTDVEVTSKSNLHTNYFALKKANISVL